MGPIEICLPSRFLCWVILTFVLARKLAIYCTCITANHVVLDDVIEPSNVFTNERAIFAGAQKEPSGNTRFLPSVSSRFLTESFLSFAPIGTNLQKAISTKFRRCVLWRWFCILTVLSSDKKELASPRHDPSHTIFPQIVATPYILIFQTSTVDLMSLTIDTSNTHLVLRIWIGND